MTIISQAGLDVTAEVNATIKKAIQATGVGPLGTLDDLRKANGTVTLSNNLVAYDLEAPAKTLYPILTPLRNAIPRITKATGAGTAVNWRQIDSIAGGSGLPAMAWVAEGQRASRMTISTSDKTASYRTIGLESDITFEAVAAAQGFEDEMAATGARLLQQTMVMEEYALLGGNASVSLGTPVTPTVANAGTGGTIAANTYNVYVFALTHEGYQMASVANGIKRQVTITGLDGLTYTLNGGSSKTSAAGSTTTSGATSTISASTTAIKGAVAYAWYVGASSAEKLEAITTINSVKLTALAGTGHAYSSISDTTTDRSANSTAAWDGLLYTGFNSSLAYYKSMATGTAGTGTPFTTSGSGTISEIDVALQSFWDNYRLSPDVIYVNSQELKNIRDKLFAGVANGTLRYTIALDGNNPELIAGVGSIKYPNPFRVDGTPIVDVKLHPFLAPGTALFWCQNLPVYYQNSNVPMVAQVQCRKDYYQIPWPIVTRANATGVYAEEVLKIYAPFALGAITNIANG